jgi:hypothetical protein
MTRVTRQNPYLVKIRFGTDVSSGEATETTWRLVFAEDKNGAWDATKDYLVNEYLIGNPATKYHITVHDTIS